MCLHPELLYFHTSQLHGADTKTTTMRRSRGPADDDVEVGLRRGVAKRGCGGKELGGGGGEGQARPTKEDEHGRRKRGPQNRQCSILSLRRCRSFRFCLSEFTACRIRACCRRIEHQPHRIRDTTVESKLDTTESSWSSRHGDVQLAWEASAGVRRRSHCRRTPPARRGAAGLGTLAVAVRGRGSRDGGGRVRMRFASRLLETGDF
jgi:hypothetical protein